MDDLEYIKKEVAKMNEGAIDRMRGVEVSPIERAKRVGMDALKDAKTRFDVILEKSDDPDMLNLAGDGMEACVEALRTLSSIK